MSQRSARWVSHPFSTWEDPADDTANIAWVRDYRRANAPFTTGGVYLNCGSAVVLPEVFLKAVALARNRGIDLTYGRVLHRAPAAVGADGEVVGVGQRRGLGISSSRPLYVVDLLPETHTIILGHEEDLLAPAMAIALLLPAVQRMRAGLLAEALVTRGHTVTWWASTRWSSRRCTCLSSVLGASSSRSPPLRLGSRRWW